MKPSVQVELSVPDAGVKVYRVTVSHTGQAVIDNLTHWVQLFHDPETPSDDEFLAKLP